MFEKDKACEFVSICMNIAKGFGLDCVILTKGAAGIIDSEKFNGVDFKGLKTLIPDINERINEKHPRTFIDLYNILSKLFDDNHSDIYLKYNPYKSECNQKEIHIHRSYIPDDFEIRFTFLDHKSNQVVGVLEYGVSSIDNNEQKPYDLSITDSSGLYISGPELEIDEYLKCVFPFEDRGFVLLIQILMGLEENLDKIS